MNVTLKNFLKVFPHTRGEFEKMDFVCTNFRKVKNIKVCLKKILNEDVAKIICSLLEDSVPEGILNPVKLREVKNFWKRDDSDEGKFFLFDKIHWTSGFYLFGVYSKKQPELVFYDVYTVNFIKTDIKMDGKFFFSLRCPLPLGRIIYRPVFKNKCKMLCWNLQRFASIEMFADEYLYPGLFEKYNVRDNSNGFTPVSIFNEDEV